MSYTIESLIQEYRKLQKIQKRSEWLDLLGKPKHERHSEQYLKLRHMITHTCWRQPEAIARLLSLDSPLTEYEQREFIGITQPGSVSLKDNMHLIEVFARLRQMDVGYYWQSTLSWYKEVHGY